MIWKKCLKELWIKGGNMIINLAELNYKDKITIDEYLAFPSEYFAKTNILSLENIHAIGFIKQNAINEVVINLKVSGIMYLPDSVTLEKIPYNLDIDIDETLEEMQNPQNTIDIMEFLWQNIVLEVPIRYTKSDADNLKGDNWKVINEDEEEEKIDPRLQKLYEYNEGGE